MKTTPAAVILLILITAAAASARQAASGGAPGLEEAARLNSEVVRLYAAGKYAEALPAAERVVGLREKALGAAHPSVGSALVNLAAVEVGLGRFDEARGHYRRAAALLEKAGDEYARTLVSALEGVTGLERDINSAVELHKRVLALKEKTFGPESFQAALSHFNLGHFGQLRRDYDEAERHFRRFVEIAEKAKGGAEDDLGVAFTRLACLERRKGRQAEAAAFELRADEIFRSVAEKRLPLEGGVVNGKAVSKPQPYYPAEAKRVGAQGTVTVEILIGETGTVLSACAQKGDRHPSLKDVSELAAYSARFSPTYLGGTPSKVRGTITYNFVLR